MGSFSLSDLSVLSRQKFSPMEMVNREEWLSQLASVRSMRCIRVKDIDFKSNKFSTVVEKIGRNLTVIDLKDICYFRFVLIYSDQ